MDSVKVATACGAGATSDRRSTSDQCDASEDEEKCLIVDVVGESEDDDDAASTVEPNLSVDADCTGKVAYLRLLYILQDNRCWHQHCQINVFKSLAPVRHIRVLCVL